MTRERWAEVDRYLFELLVREDAALEQALAASAAAGLPPIQVAPNQGKLLMLLARMLGARAILEIGTLAGYSAIWLARALPDDGGLITLEIDARYAALARDNVARAGLGQRVEVRLGPALETLPALAAEGAGPFDLVFIDADKPSCVEYFEWALRLTRPGSAIVVDNVVRGGAVADAATADASVRGVQRLLERMATEPRVEATAIQTVGEKGHDGLAIALVQALETCP